MSGVGMSSETAIGGSSTNTSGDLLHTDNEASSQDSECNRKHDVFISYRRQTGKHLAGLVSLSLNVKVWSLDVAYGNFHES